MLAEGETLITEDKKVVLNRRNSDWSIHFEISASILCKMEIPKDQIATLLESELYSSAQILVIFAYFICSSEPYLLPFPLHIMCSSLIFFCFLSLIRVLFSFHRLPLILKPILTSRLKIWLLFFISLLLLLLTSLLSFLILSSCIIPDFSWRRIVSREGVSQSDSELLEEIFFSWLN